MKIPMFVGLDIETTGTDIDAGAGLIQIGVHGPNLHLNQDVHPHAGYVWTEQAREVNGFTDERVDAAPSLEEVDENTHLLLSTYLKDNEADHFMPIGWNVGTFDMPFIRRFLPKTASLFGYRSIDLNAVVYTISPRGAMKLKKYLKRAAAAAIAPIENWHDAGYDAKAALEVWYILNEHLMYSFSKEAV